MPVAVAVPVLAQSQAPPAPTAGGGQLILAALLGIATVVLLISWLKVHPFLALILGSAVLGIVAGLGAADDDQQLHHRGGRRRSAAWAARSPWAR